MTNHTEPSGLDRRQMIGAGLGVLGGAVALSALASPSAEAAAEASARFYAYGPQRITDSRSGAGKINREATRNISLSSVFASGFALTAIINVTVTATEGAGYLTLWEAGQTKPSTSNISWWGSGQGYGNMAFVGLRSSDVNLSVYCSGNLSARTHYIIDLLGYFYLPAGAEEAPPRGVEKR